MARNGKKKEECMKASMGFFEIKYMEQTLQSHISLISADEQNNKKAEVKRHK